MKLSGKIMKVICTVLLIGASLFAHGQSTIWVYSGSGSPSWENAAHWSQGVPNSIFVAIIPENNSNIYPIINPQSDVGVAFARATIINSGASFTGQSALSGAGSSILSISFKIINLQFDLKK